MRALGAALLLAGGLWGAVLWCRRGRACLALGQALLRQLTVLRRGILTLRRPLGDLAADLAAESPLTAPFWQALLLALRREQSFARCWREALAVLPAPYGELLSPLGAVLSLGEGEAASLLDQASEDLTRHLRRERQSRRERERLTVALALSAAAMVALALY